MMMPKYNIATASCLVSLLAITGCQSPSAESSLGNGATSSTTAVLTTALQNQHSLTQQAQRIQTALATGNYQSITNDIHPTRGVRFSMYAYVRPDVDKVFTRNQFAQYLQESTIRFTWGQKDGTGDLYVTPLPNYLEDWVKADYFSDQSTTINTTAAVGNSINNLDQIYQNSDYVEFYNSGVNPEYGGLDWRALRLVFDEYQGKRYLVAIISDQWTT